MIYQIYPKSFQDTNGDGVGATCGGSSSGWTTCKTWASTPSGSTRSTSHQAWTTAMTSPTTKPSTPPQYGTMADMEELISEAKKRGIRIVMDLVVNHTSDQHHWFIEARKNPSSPEHDYYVWADKANELKSLFPAAPGNMTARLSSTTSTFLPKSSRTSTGRTRP